MIERKTAEEALRESEERFGAVFENKGIAIIIVEEDTTVSLVNGEAVKLTGYTKGEIEGKISWRDFVFEGYNPSAVPGSYEIRIFKKNGSIKDCIATSSIIPGTKKYVVSLLDVTGQRQLEKEIARLDRLNMVGEMAASIGHEIRNPMTAVRGFLQLLAEKKECTGYRVYFDLMIEELDRSNSIVTEFLSLARQRPADKKLSNINSIIKNLLPLVLSDAIKNCMAVDVEQGEIPLIYIDENEIKQIILNLVRNGLEAMSPGGRMIISTYREGESVILSLKDQGPGIVPDVLEKLGTPFFSTKEKGTGLGLMVSYSLAARNNAKIEIETGTGGTIFRVRFIAGEKLNV